MRDPGNLCNAGLDREVVLDITRLSFRFSVDTPAGIDRVDSSFAAHFLPGAAANRKALLYTPAGPRAIAAAAARRLSDAVQAHWRESLKPEADEAFVRLRAALAGAAAPAPPRRTGGAARLWGRAARLHAAAWTAIEPIGADAIYLNVCQFPLWSPRYFRWLQRRPDIRPVFLVHDLLPIEHPEFFPPSEHPRHIARMAVLARIGAAAVVATEPLAEALLAYLARLGRRTMPVLVQPLPVATAFQEPRQIDEGLAAQPYFVACGTIEPRKNHLLLLHLWRGLARAMGPATPKLIVAGKRGWENENVLDLLERCPELRGHVIEAPGLSTQALKRLLDNARAVLMPSFAEGYGLPVAEALAAGAPVIASDLPSFRAMDGTGVTYLDPLDGPGWFAAIGRACEAPPRPTQDRANPSPGIPTVQAYFDRIEAFLAGV